MSHKSGNFILLVEIVDRELPANVLLGAELAGRGHAVWLIEKGRFRKSPASFPPSVVLEKGLTKGSLPRFRAVRGAGHVLAVMCQEGFIYRHSQDYISRRVCADTVRNIDYLLLWGEKQKQDLQGFLGDVRGFRVTGNPRFDLLHRRFRKCWETQEIDIRREHGEFILFTSRFSAVNHFRRELAETVDRRRELYAGEAAKSVQERHEFLKRVFVDYMDIVDEIATRFPKLKFVLRPHPIENAEVWRTRYKHAGNILIRDHGAAIPWLIAARCVIHNACTTGIEAYMLDKPVTEYYPAKIARNEFDPVLPGQITGTCNSADALAAWIETNVLRIGPNCRNESADRLIAYHLQNFWEPNAYRKMATALEGFRQPRPWARLMNKLSRKRDFKKMQQRYLNLGEVNTLLQAFIDCEVGNRFVRAVTDEIGIRLERGSEPAGVT
jgi:surface carbohydrate biosynthesis protein